MSRFRSITLAVAFGALASTVQATTEASEVGRFTWSTSSKEAKSMLSDLQNRIENFEGGPALAELARKIVDTDPQFAMGEYYLSAVDPNEAQLHLDRATELAKNASDGERRFIEAMVVVRANGGADLQKGIPLFEKLAADYPHERLVFMLLGQIYQGAGQTEQARSAFETALAIGPPSPRARAFVANDDLLKGRYADARATLESVAESLPDGAAPALVRYGIAFSHLYEGNADKALAALNLFLDEYRTSGATRAFPEVFIWNSIARIELESGRPGEALEAYKKGYDSVPSSNLADDQKQVWLGRFRHGQCRALAKLGRHEEAAANAKEILEMIEQGGESARQYLPAYHYLMGYLELERGDFDAAVEDLTQSDPNDPFHKLLLARAYERKGDKTKALQAYRDIVSSTANGLERALAYPEAKRKLATL